MLGLGFQSSAGRDPRPSGEEIPGPEPGSQAQLKGRPWTAAGAASRSALCPFPLALSLGGSGVCETQTSPRGHGLPAWTRPKPQAQLPSAPALGHGHTPRMCAWPDWGMCSQQPRYLPISRCHPPPGRSGLAEPRAPSLLCCCRPCSLLPPGPQPACSPSPSATQTPTVASSRGSASLGCSALTPAAPRPAPRLLVLHAGPSLWLCPLSSGWHHACARGWLPSSSWPVPHS